MSSRNPLLATMAVLWVHVGTAAASGSLKPATTNRDPLTETTVIIHGFQLSGTAPDWPFHMAEAVRVRTGNGRIFEIDKTTGDLLDCGHPACGPQGTGGESIIVYDWAAASVASGTGFSEAAAESLAADLVRWHDADPPLVELGNLHLIGHSRGAVVASETAERLIAAGRPAPEQLTSLDPHDTGAFFADEEQTEPEGLWDDLDVNDLHPDYSCGPLPGETSGVCSWQGVGFHDNYWRDQDDFPCFFDPDGKVVPGSTDFDGSGLDGFCHSDVHAWYHFTIDTTAASHPVTGDPPGPDWFEPTGLSCETTARTAPLARTVDGYNASRVGGAVVRCPTDEPAQQRVLFDFGLAEGVVNGGFDKDPDGADLAGWKYHGGGGNGVLANDGDSFLQLDAGQWRRHGRFLVPANANGLRFCWTVLTAGADDILTLTLEQDDASHVLFETNPNSVSGWQCEAVPVDNGARNRPCTLLISMHDDGTPPLARAGLDDIGLIVAIFTDGFESGDTTRWSGVSP